MPGARNKPARSRRSSGRGGRRGNSAVSRINPPATTIVYRGPVRMPSSYAPPPVLVPLTLVAVINANASGIASGFLINDPYNTDEWSLLAGLYTEYRVLSLAMRFVPYQHNFPAATPQNPGQLVWYSRHDSSIVTPATSLAQAWQYTDAVVKNGDQPHQHSVRMAGTLEATWHNTSANAGIPYAGIGFYGTDFTVSTKVGTQYVTMMVQFRERS